MGLPELWEATLRANLHWNHRSLRLCFTSLVRDSLMSLLLCPRLLAFLPTLSLSPVRCVALLLSVGCLESQQYACVSQDRICSDYCTCCHTETDVEDKSLYCTQSHYTDTGTTSPSPHPLTPGAMQVSYWSTNFEVTGVKRRSDPDLPL